MSEKSVSDRKRAANRANARKSTGPKTPEGKARVRFNALKHGLLAEHIVLPDDEDEQIEELQNVWNRLREDLAPSTMLEELLIERLAASYWRLRRAYRFEVQSIDEARDAEDTPMRQLCSRLTGRTAPKLPPLLPAQVDFDKLLRYEGLIDRHIHRITLQLIRLRSAGISSGSQASSLPPISPPAPPDDPAAPSAPVPAQPLFDGTKPPTATTQACEPQPCPPPERPPHPHGPSKPENRTSTPPTTSMPALVGDLCGTSGKRLGFILDGFPLHYSMFGRFAGAGTGRGNHHERHGGTFRRPASAHPIDLDPRGWTGGGPAVRGSSCRPRARTSGRPATPPGARLDQRNQQPPPVGAPGRRRRVPGPMR